MTIGIVNFPMDSMVIFHSYVSHYQSVDDKFIREVSITIWGIHDFQGSLENIHCNYIKITLIT